MLIEVNPKGNYSDCESIKGRRLSDTESMGMLFDDFPDILEIIPCAKINATSLNE